MGEVLNPTEDDEDNIVPGLMAIGEAACASIWCKSSRFKLERLSSLW